MAGNNKPWASRSTTRRSFLAAAGTVGVVGVAGCLGDDVETVTISGAFSGSTTDRAGRAVERAVNDHSESVRVSVTESGGWVENSRLYDGGEVESIGMDDLNAVRALDGRAPYDQDPISRMPLQGYHFEQMDNWMMGIEGSGIETTDDLPGRDVYVLAPGMGTRVALEEVLRNAGYWDDINHVEVGPPDLPGAIEEGRIEAAPGQGSGGVELLGYIQEIDARADVYALEHTDTWVSGIEATEGLVINEIEPYGYNQDIDDITSEVTAFGLTAQWRFGPDVSSDAVYEIGRVIHEHYDTVLEGDATYPDMTDPANMMHNLHEDQPVHPGAAEFFEDHGVWDDSYTVGEDEYEF